MNNDAINEYVLDSGFLFSLSNHLWNVVQGVDQAYNEQSRNEGIWNEFEDTLYYVNDIIEQESPEITEKLSNLIIRMLFPGLIGCLLQKKKVYNVSQKVALWVLAKIYEIIKGKTVIEAALILFFKKEVNKNLIEIVENPPPSLPPENFSILSGIHIENLVFEKVKELMKSSDSDEIFFLLLIIQNAIHSQAVSKEILSELGILSQKLLRNQKLVSIILQEDPPKTLNHNSEVLDMLFYLLHKETLKNFSEYQVVCHIIFELTGSSTTSLDPSHESLLNETFLKKSLDLHEVLNDQSMIQWVINSFKSEWNYIRNLNFHTTVPAPNIKNLNSTPGFLRKSSNENYLGLEKLKIQDNLRTLFLVMKLKFLSCQEQLPENPLNRRESDNWVPGEYINTSKWYSDNVKYEKAKLDKGTVLIPDNENLFILLEFSKELFPLCVIKTVHDWSDLKIAVNQTTCTVKITTMNSNENFILQLCSREDSIGLVNFLRPKIKFALSVKTQLIRSFFEEFYQRL